MRGERYDALVAAYVEAATKLFPNALLHSEDFGASNARRILNQYRDKVRIFNDDIQGTGAITVAVILAGLRVAKTRASEQRVVIFGAGTAGMGIADQIRTIMVNDGLGVEQATRQFWAVDKQGLLLDTMRDLRDFQQPYARPASEVAGWGSTDLAGVVANVHPTIIVGTSTIGGAFTEEIVREMAKNVERLLIFPLSNPTERIEAIPADLIKWTDGRALIGTGTPWAPVPHKGVDYQIGQANNALVYPGIGLGTIVSRAQHVTDAMLLAAAEAIAGLVETGRPGAGLLPDVENLHAASATLAVAVANQAVKDGVADPLDDPVQAVHAAIWQAVYRAVEVKSWPGRLTASYARCRSARVRPGRGWRVTRWVNSRSRPSTTGGAQTQRSLIHFSIGDDHMPKAVYHAYGYVKKAAASAPGWTRRKGSASRLRPSWPSSPACR